MDENFWHDRWRTNEIGFHEGQPNGLLVEHFEKLSLEPGARVFLPLCGKTRDIAWLLGKGYEVAGAELNSMAVHELFSELGVEPELSRVRDLVHYRASGIDLYAGDIFSLDSVELGPVDGVYDRAALVALPETMRRRYAMHMIALTGAASQFLICFEYCQDCMKGPPFSVTGGEVLQHYGERYVVTKAAGRDVPGGLKGKCAATETAWLLHAVRPATA